MLNIADHNLRNVLIFFTVAALGFALQLEKIPEIFGVSPNFVLVSMVAATVYFKPKKNKFFAVFLMFAGIFFLSLFWVPFWIELVIVIGFISIITAMVADKMAGNNIIDGVIIIIFATPAFYLSMTLFGGTIIWFAILKELVYNVITLIAVFLFADKIINR